MPITQRGSSYQVTINKGRDRIRKQFSTEFEAQSFEAEVKSQLAKGKHLKDIDIDNLFAPKANLQQTPEPTAEGLFKKRKWMFAEAANLVFEDHWKGSKSEDTVKQNVNLLKQQYAGLSLQDIDEDRVQMLIQYLKSQGKSKGTINRKLSALRVILTKCVRDYKRLEFMPHIPTLEEAAAHPRFLTEPEYMEVTSMAERVGKHWLRDMIVVAVHTGIRQGNLLQLRRRNIDIDSKELRFNTTEVKNVNASSTKGYSVALNATAFEVVHRRLKEMKPDQEYLFDVSKDSLDYHWGHVCDLSGVKARWHDLRHTFGSWLVQQGVDLGTVSRMMNHSNIQVTMRYAWLAPNQYHNKVSVLDSIGRGQ